MAAATDLLAAAIETALDAAEGNETPNPDYASDLAAAIETFVTSAVVAAAIPVQVVPVSGTGATTGTGVITVL